MVPWRRDHLLNISVFPDIFSLIVFPKVTQYTQEVFLRAQFIWVTNSSHSFIIFTMRRRSSFRDQAYGMEPYRADLGRLVAELATNVETGLTKLQAQTGLRDYGENKLRGEGVVKWYNVLLKQCSNAMILVRWSQAMSWCSSKTGFILRTLNGPVPSYLLHSPWMGRYNQRYLIHSDPAMIIAVSITNNY
jgi:hypothetical protein